MEDFNPYELRIKLSVVYDQEDGSPEIKVELHYLGQLIDEDSVYISL